MYSETIKNTWFLILQPVSMKKGRWYIDHTSMYVQRSENGQFGHAAKRLTASYDVI